MQGHYSAHTQLQVYKHASIKLNGIVITTVTLNKQENHHLYTSVQNHLSVSAMVTFVWLVEQTVMRGE